jgi:hypothetical protein
MKVLFLDIDGVLNSARSCVANHGYPHGFDGHNMAMFDEVAVKLIRGLCAKGGVSVVVSSAWRILHHWDDIGRNLQLPTMGATPRGIGERGKEIAEWLAEHPEVTQYAIVDDDDDMLPEQRPFFVKTNGMEGLSFADFEKLCSLFGVNVYDCAPTRVRQGNVTKLVWDDL